jgi:hypothetical protein
LQGNKKLLDKKPLDEKLSVSPQSKLKLPRLLG